MSFEREIKKFLKQKNKQKSLILSGGSSITKIYKKISRIKADWKNINIYLVDERKISKKQNQNLFLLKKFFRKKKINKFNEKLFLKKNEKKIIHNLSFFKSLCIIGMGDDGHFASIFKNLKKYKDIINVRKKPKLIFTEKVGIPFCKRFTMNLSMILLSTKIIIVLKNKKRITLFLKFINDKNKKTPIYYLVKNVKKKMIINFNKDFLELNKFRKKYAK